MPAGRARLMFSIFHGILLGEAGGRSIFIAAVSGGGGGSKSTRPGWIDLGVVNNPSETSRKEMNKKSGHRHGGPLPAGWYTIARPEANHQGKGRWASLLPFPENVMLGRDGMAIHGRGQHGSDGCIVPTNPADFQLLMDALEADGGGVLQVLPFWLAPGGVGK
jgi:hypothetical protein